MLSEPIADLGLIKFKEKVIPLDRHLRQEKVGWNNLKGHEKRHWESESNRESEAQCRFCDKRISRNNLKGHVKRHMESQSCQALPCGQCDKVFNSE